MYTPRLLVRITGSLFIGNPFILFRVMVNRKHWEQRKNTPCMARQSITGTKHTHTQLAHTQENLH